MIKILKMLEDAESDKDELNARIWCFENEWDWNLLKDGKERKSDGSGEIMQVYSSWREYRDVTKYTISLDAAMSIGAEELRGWVMDMTTLGQAWIQPFEAFKKSKFEAINLPSLPRAICSARLQALDYVRGL